MLGNALQHSGMGLIADCLMSNHFHLSLSGSSSQLTKCMHRLDRAYSGYHNSRYGLSGHAFEQEYYCEPIPSEFILKRVVRYIHLNPVRAGIVAKAEEYPWSGYRRLTTSDPKSLGKEETRFLGLFDGSLDIAQSKFRAFVEKDSLRKISIPAGRPPAWELWQEQFSWILEHALASEVFLYPLEPQNVAVYLGSRAGVPPRAMGAALGHSSGRQSSLVACRLSELLESNPALRLKVEALHVL
jgi:REP element-mobilizing transposase RayT